MPKPRREGYLLIDNRYSPGVSPEFVHASGIDAPIVLAGQTFEAATMTCAHCNGTIIKNPLRTRKRGYCAKCDAYVCDNPGCGLECRPFQKMLDIAHAQASRILLGRY